MKKKQILILLMGAMMALSACQATPEEDVIVQKAEQQEKLTQAADVAPELVGKSLREQMNIPETISFQVTDSSGKHIYTADNAPVNVPDTDKASTANAIRDDFTDEDTRIWTEAFFGNAKVWKTEEYVATKSDYMVSSYLWIGSIRRMKTGSRRRRTWQVMRTTGRISRITRKNIRIGSMR